ncbi:MAG: heme o synthase [Geminicoccaceae bacterium]
MASLQAAEGSPDLALRSAAGGGGSELRDFWILVKPSVMQLVVFTAWVALYLAPAQPHPVMAFTAILCIALGAGAAAAINNWFDSDIDGSMGRTRLRPTVNGRVDPAEALGFGIALSIISVMTMGLAVNWLAASLLAFTIAFYVLVYTMWLKRRTPQNIVIGGAAGAFPPLVAWAAATGTVDMLPVLMFLIIFLWTPPHFWALALYRSADYARVDVPMLPVVAGRLSTRRHILGYCLLLLPVSLAPCVWGGLGLVYGAGALALNLVFTGYAWKLLRDDSDRTAMLTFRFSLVYLFALFGLMAADRAWGLGWGVFA